MKPNLLRILPLAAVAAMGFSGVASSQTINQLIAAAKSEGELTIIALPHDWCGYGAVIDGFKAKYGLKVNELNPDAGSGDEIEAIKANKGNKGPQAPDVIDVGLSFGPSAKADGLLQPYKVSTWDTIPDSAKDADGYWYGDYYGVLAFEVNKDIVKKAPADWADLLKPEYKNAVALAGDPRASNQAIQGVYRRRALGRAAATSPRPATPGSSSSPSSTRTAISCRSSARPASLAQGATPDHPALGLQRAGRPRHAEGQPAGRRRRAEDRRRRRRLRPGDQRLRAASERRQALDGVPLLRRGPARLAQGLLPPDPLQRSGREQEDPGRRSWPSCRRPRAMPRPCSRRSTSRRRRRRSSPSSGTPSSAPT